MGLGCSVVLFVMWLLLVGVDMQVVGTCRSEYQLWTERLRIDLFLAAVEFADLILPMVILAEGGARGVLVVFS